MGKPPIANAACPPVVGPLALPALRARGRVRIDRLDLQVALPAQHSIGRGGAAVVIRASRMDKAAWS